MFFMCLVIFSLQSAICPIFSLILYLKIRFSSLICLLLEDVSLTTFFAIEIISGVTKDLLRHMVKKSFLLFNVNCFILSFTSIIRRFFPMAGWLSRVTNLSMEDILFVDTDLTEVNVVYVRQYYRQLENKKNCNVNEIYLNKVSSFWCIPHHHQDKIINS